jgi:hypothetical protein
MKLKTQIAILTFAVAAVAASSLLVWSDPGESHAPTIEGVWQVNRGGVSCDDPNQEPAATFPAIMTFHRDGTLTGAAKSPVTGPFDTAEYGTWEREPGSQSYSLPDVAYRYDGTGTFLGPLILTANVELTGANTFIYSSRIQLVDADGELIATHCGRATATRF